MARAPGLTLRQSQRLALTPTMRAQLAILGLSAEALAEELARAAAENPCLTLRPPRGTPTAYEIALADTAAPVPLSESLAAQIGLQRLARPVAAAAQLLIAELREDGSPPRANLPSNQPQRRRGLALAVSAIDMNHSYLRKNPNGQHDLRCQDRSRCMHSLIHILR